MTNAFHPENQPDFHVLPVALRDTALLVTQLMQDGVPGAYDGFRRTCKEQVAHLRKQMSAKGHPADVVEDAAYAQCALLDEITLSCLSGNDRDQWEREPLQVQEFRSHDAGDELIRRIERRLSERQPSLTLLAVFNAVLSLGFKGRFALDGEDARSALMHAIDERLQRGGWRRADPATTTVIVTAPYARPWYRRMNALAWVAAACVVSGVVYLMLDRWLSASIENLAR
ncbi:DotU family type IV/VI secretion system protein [Paraburkholderia diazotrophica]|uniref:Type VI secretion system protein ImpK n=1 Tax=Paraburkholderia diazotrophica TaxID=667676 RepID=A0A1H7CDX3_9BURK|nr:DotU family type IV/VI secretion system protein [Paraburkholderia diazotrophica]SEJ87901.1 type VI secretion system protein ImpK [Paraburkholderia diazotrophica]